jgi:opacity protein-like surface antigen
MNKRIWIVGILSVLFVSGLAFGKSNIGFNGIGAKIGYIMPESPIENTIGFGAVADLGTLTPALKFEGELLYWSKGYTAADYEWSYSQIYISALVKYFFPQKKNAKWLPYAGGGVGLVIGKSKSEYKGAYSMYVSDKSSSISNTDLGIHLLGGVKTVLSPTMDGFAEARYSIDGADFFGLFVGAIFKLNK